MEKKEMYLAPEVEVLEVMIINLKTENDYGKERNVFGSGSRGSGGDG